MKERLTGAAILVALIVLLVPELLRGPVRPVAHAEAASAGDPPLRSYTIKLGEDTHAHGAATPAASGPQQPAPIPSNTDATPQAAQPRPQAAEPTPAPPTAPTATAVTAKPVSTAPPTERPPQVAPAPVDASAAAGAFVVQLGSFASRANADRLAKQVRAQGLPVTVSRGSTGRHLYKVLVGPARDHAAAAQLEAKLRSAGHTGSIVAK